MQGTIISLKNNELVIESDNHVIYSAPFDKSVAMGNRVEFEATAKKSFLKLPKAHVISIVDMPAYTDKIAVSDTLEVKDHQVLEYKDNVIIAAEGASKEEALKAIIEVAQNNKANAILDLKLDCNYSSIHKGCLYRYTGLAAMVDGPRFTQTPGAHISLNKNKARLNSPNKAMARYIRVLLCCFFLIEVPCVLRTIGLLGWDLKLANIPIAISAIALIAIGLSISPKKTRGFLLRVNKRHTI